MENDNGKESFYRDTIDDMGSEKYELEDPMTFWNAEKKTLWKKIAGRTETPFLMLGIALVVIIVIFFAVFPRGSGQDVSGEIEALSDRLQQIEVKLDAVVPQGGGSDETRQDIELLKKSVLRLDTTDASISLRIDRIAEDLATLKKEMEEVGNKSATATKSATTAAPSEKQQTASQALTYEVQAGDTLYSISHRHGLTVDLLRKLNDLSEQDTIHPGQKLKVKGD